MASRFGLALEEIVRILFHYVILFCFLDFKYICNEKYTKCSSLLFEYNFTLKYR